MEGANLRGVIITGLAAILGGMIGSATSGYFAAETAKMNMHSDVSYKLSSELKIKAGAYYKADEKMASLHEYGELSREMIIPTLRAYEDAVADLIPLFPMELEPSLKMLIDANRC